ncbi:nucleotidyltransferase domain-containing protein [Klebsiella pneumoniae]
MASSSAISNRRCWPLHLYGSAVDGGLKPRSDIDLLVTVTVKA